MNSASINNLTDQIVIIGGGLAGVSTLFALARRGIPATLLEARDSVALETSFANGSMLTPSMSEPWNSPGVGYHLFNSLFRQASGIKLNWAAIPDLMRWGAAFLGNSRQHRYYRSMLANFHLSHYSNQLTNQWRDELNLDYDCLTTGTMKVFSKEKNLHAYVDHAATLAEHGLCYRVLNAAEAIGMDPALANACYPLIGAIHYPHDGIGDAHTFTRQLAAHAQQLGAAVHTGITVEQVITDNQQVSALLTDHGEIKATTVVLANGVLAPALVKTLGIHLPIKPVKGYSATLTVDDSVKLPELAIVDDSLHGAVVPLGRRLRFAGIAEFAGVDRRINSAAIRHLWSLFEVLYPQIAARYTYTDLETWAGLRPMSSDGVPFIGRTESKGLWVNAGHGHLGWTMAAGSAELLADMIVKKKPAIDPSAYAVNR